MAVGVGAPAFAATGAFPAPTNLNSGVDALFAQQPLQKAGDEMLSNGVLGTVTKGARSLQGNALLGQAADTAKSVMPFLLGGLPVTSLLGGLSLAG
jgi:hypothetical protein